MAKPYSRREVMLAAVATGWRPETLWSRQPQPAARPLELIAVFPDQERIEEAKRLAGESGVVEKVREITGAAADKVLAEAAALQAVLVRGAGEVPVQDDIRANFSRSVTACLDVADGDRFLVLSPGLVPMDVVRDADGDWGLRAIFSHVPVGGDHVTNDLKRHLERHREPLRTYLLVAAMAMERSRRRHEQDIVEVASELEGRIPVEIWLQPPAHRSLQAFGRTDVSWVHVDTHGDASGGTWMLSPTREGGRYSGVDALPDVVRVPLVISVGCSLNAGPRAIGAELLRRGATSVLGPMSPFVSLGVTGSEAAEASWYRTLLTAMLDGQDVGSALLHARRSVSGTRIQRYCWVILGCSTLSFH